MECLESLANTDCFSVLQEKLNCWRYEFQMNGPECNIGRCCELIELNAKIQAQLFKLLGVCAMYGGLNGSSGSKILRQLEPVLGQDYLRSGLTKDVVLDILSDIGRRNANANQRHRSPKRSKSRKVNGCIDKAEPSTTSLDPQINNRLEDLEHAIIALAQDQQCTSDQPHHHRSTSSRKKYRKKLSSNNARSHSLPDYSDGSSNHQTDEDPNCALRLKVQRGAVTDPPSECGDYSAADCSEVTQIRSDTYLQGLVARYNDLFSESRIQAMDVLREYHDDHENNQRIIFALIMTVARCVVERQRTLRNPYGTRNGAAQNLQFREPVSRSGLRSIRGQTIHDMLHKGSHNKHRHSRFHLPHGFTFSELTGFIDRAVEMFWNFGGTLNGLNLLEAADGECFDEHKYRRSYDSDYVAPLVSHHIWPCLLQGSRVLVKGEACTRASSQMNVSRSICATNKRSPKN